MHAFEARQLVVFKAHRVSLEYLPTRVDHFKVHFKPSSLWSRSINGEKPVIITSSIEFIIWTVVKGVMTQGQVHRLILIKFGPINDHVPAVVVPIKRYGQVYVIVWIVEILFSLC